MYRNYAEARAAFEADRPHFEALGAVLPDVQSYLWEGTRQNYDMAMDAAQPTLTTAPNSGVPAMFTTLVDPNVYKILFAPNQAAIIFGEQKKGSWTDDTAMFPVVEHTGEVSSYGDWATSGRAGANTNWPQRQAYLFQTVKEYGERELARAGLAKLNWVSEIDGAAADILNKFQNLTYFYGVVNLQNYGLLNDPNLPASLTPSVKAVGGNKWVNNGVVVATANEIFNDFQSLFMQLVTQNAGLVDAKASVVVGLSPASSVALTATNSFNVNVADLLKKNFPNIRIETAVQYGVQSAANPQGIVAGNMVQMHIESVEGQDTGYCAFNEKMRSHTIVKDLSSFRQKVTGGSWGAIIRMPVAFVSMIGV